MPLAIGHRIGSYEVLGLIGAGGMGEVYRAGDARLGRDVAIKVLPPDVASDHDRVLRFEREARVLATPSHPNIAVIHGVEDAPSRPGDTGAQPAACCITQSRRPGRWSTCRRPMRTRWP